MWRPSSEVEDQNSHKINTKNKMNQRITWLDSARITWLDTDRYSRWHNNENRRKWSPASGAVGHGYSHVMLPRREQEPRRGLGTSVDHHRVLTAVVGHVVLELPALCDPTRAGHFHQTVWWVEWTDIVCLSSQLRIWQRMSWSRTLSNKVNLHDIWLKLPE